MTIKAAKVKTPAIPCAAGVCRNIGGIGVKLPVGKMSVTLSMSVVTTGVVEVRAAVEFGPVGVGIGLLVDIYKRRGERTTHHFMHVGSLVNLRHQNPNKHSYMRCTSTTCTNGMNGI